MGILPCRFQPCHSVLLWSHSGIKLYLLRLVLVGAGGGSPTGNGIRVITGKLSPGLLG